MLIFIYTIHNSYHTYAPTQGKTRTAAVCINLLCFIFMVVYNHVWPVGGYPEWLCVSVFFTLNRCFCSSTSSTRSVCADSSPREMKSRGSQRSILQQYHIRQAHIPRLLDVVKRNNVCTIDGGPRLPADSA